MPTPRVFPPFASPLLPLLLVSAFTAGCSVRGYALRATADALSQSGGGYGEDDDPELVRDAAPFGLKTMESLAAQVPNHRGLRLSLASGFTEYAYAFVQQEADRAEDKDLERARHGWLRARRLYLRARDHGLAGLDLSHRGLAAALRSPRAEVRTAALAQATRADVPLLYWTGAAWALAVATGKDVPDLVGDLPAVEAIMARALALDEAWGHGAIHEFYVSYDGTRGAAQGGGPERARAHLLRAQALSQGHRLGGLVAYAEGVLVSKQDKAEFTRVLQQVVAADVYAPDPAWRRERLANIIAQRRAAWLLGRTADLFAD